MTEAVSSHQITEFITRHTPFPDALGIRVLHAEPGIVHMSIAKRPDLRQISGFFHGGVIAGLADHAACLAAGTALPLGRAVATIDLQINFLSAADGESIIARAKTVQTGKTVCVATVEISTMLNAQERLCAISTVTMRTTDLPPEVLKQMASKSTGG